MPTEIAITAAAQALTDVASRVTGQADIWDAASAAKISDMEAWKTGETNPYATQRIYIDPINGDDLKPGNLVTEAVKTWNRAQELMVRTLFLEMYLLNDLEIIGQDQPLIRIPPRVIGIFGMSGDGLTFVQRQLKFSDGVTVTRGSFLTLFGGGTVRFKSLDLVHNLNNTAGGGVILFSNGFASAVIESCTLTKTGTGGGPLFDSTTGCSVNFTAWGLTLDPSAAGFVLDGVAAGADPNARWNTVSNLTTI